MSYTEVSISGYNASPPPDDGSQSASNQVSWAAIKTKLADPIKTAVETMDDRIASAITTTDAYPATWAAADTSTQTSTLSTLRAELNAPSGTVMLFVQTAAPTGWTKQTDHNNKALRLVTGTVSTGGSTAFTSVLTSRTIAQANLPVVNWSHSLTAATHTHSFSGSVSGTTGAGSSHTHGAGSYAVGTSITNGTSVARNFTEEKTNRDNSGSVSIVQDVDWDDSTLSLASGTVSGTSAAEAAHTHSFSDSFSGTTGASGALAVSGTVSSGGSGTALDFAVQYVDVIYATKS